MEQKYFVLGLLETVLGRGKRDKDDNYVFDCPICMHKKPKLVVNVRTGQYNCWTCHPPTKGANPTKLLKQIGANPEYVKEMNQYFSLAKKSAEAETEYEQVTLPAEFISLKEVSSLETKHALAYLQKRGITKRDITKYNIGYCDSGKYRGRVIIPSYDENCRLNYFIARLVKETGARKYDTPSCKKSEIIGFDSLINWDAPVVLCEGAFDAIALKRNAIPLFGKTIPKSIMMKLAKNSVKTVYLALDNDAIKESMDSATKLMNMGKDVYLLDLKDKDPSEMGFEKSLSLFHNAQQLTFEKMFAMKMGMTLK
jgi:DNA primase